VIAPRPSRPGDEAALRALWKTVFGDSDLFLDDFFTMVYRPGMAALIEDGGEVVSAAYALPLENALYLYALATLPACRGRGFGKAVTHAVLSGRPAYLYPASESLRDWYRREMGARDCLFSPALSPLPEDALPISAEEYSTAREALLKGTPHAVYPLSFLRFFERSGRFYRGARGIWAVSSEGAVKEALPGVGQNAHAMCLNGAPPLYLGLVLD